MSKSITRAEVTITITVDVGSSWGEDCKLEQVYKQASQEAVSKIFKLIENQQCIHLIGITKVKAITTERDY